MHGVSEEGGEGVALADRLLFVSLDQLVELRTLLILGEDLEAEVVVADVLLVDSKHRKKHVEEISSTEDHLPIYRHLSQRQRKSRTTNRTNRTKRGMEEENENSAGQNRRKD